MHYSDLLQCTEKKKKIIQTEAVPQNPQTTNVEKGMAGREPSYTVGGNVNWYSHYENGMEVPSQSKIRKKKSKIRTTM